MQTPWDHRYAQRTQRMKSSAIRELLKLTEDPDIISFAGGLPAPEVFPVQEIRRGLRTRPARARRPGAAVWHHRRLPAPARNDRPPHQPATASQVTPDNIMITSGSQQALDLLGKIFINRGDRILVEVAHLPGRAAGLECLRRGIRRRSVRMKMA